MEKVLRFFRICFGQSTQLSEQDRALAAKLHAGLIGIAVAAISIWFWKTLSHPVSDASTDSSFESLSLARVAIGKLILFPLVFLVAIASGVWGYKAAARTVLPQLRQGAAEDPQSGLVKAIILAAFLLGACLVAAAVL